MSTEQQKIHFISGLPRSGSTLLSAILLQNPKCHAGMSSPLAEVVAGVLRTMSSKNPLTFQTSDAQRESVLKSVVKSYYTHMTGKALVFDTSRAWCTLVPLLANMFPSARIICCIRSPAWILDSVEQIIQSNVFQPSKMFDSEPLIAQGSRVDAMVRPSGFLGGPMSALQQAWYSNFADRLIAVRYESLVEKPKEVIAALYKLLGEDVFAHDFDNVHYEAPEFDGALGTPGLHTVRPKVEIRTRETLLPPQLFSRFEQGFWDLPEQNPNGVKILFEDRHGKVDGIGAKTEMSPILSGAPEKEAIRAPQREPAGRLRSGGIAV